jgi:predicted AAA+ superfamily ATPase
MQSAIWRKDLIQDYLNRDIPQFGVGVPAPTMMRFWRMLAHYHGGILNASKLGQALDVSHSTIRRYLDILEQTFMVRILRPSGINIKKRLVKSPKVYIRDSGILHALLEIDTMTGLYGHPAFGASWEGWCIEQITGIMPMWNTSFFRSSSGEEIDLILERGQRRFVFEIKASLSPHLSRGFSGTLEILKPERAWIVCPMDEPGYPTRSGARVTGIRECLRDLQGFGAARPDGL